MYIGNDALLKLSQIEYITGSEQNGWAELDHSSLPAGLKAEISREIYKDRKTLQEYELNGIPSILDSLLIEGTEEIDGVEITVFTEKLTGKKYYTKNSFINERFSKVKVKSDGENMNGLIDLMMKAILELKTQVDSLKSK